VFPLCGDGASLGAPMGRDGDQVELADELPGGEADYRGEGGVGQLQVG
jgi:hypothetical protein